VSSRPYKPVNSCSTDPDRDSGMKVVAITQARMGSTRLPGKILADLAGESMLVRHIQRLSKTSSLDEIVVATTDRALDDLVVSLCNEREWLCFRGSEQDTLDRFYRAAMWRDADLVIRTTADCPLIEPSIVEEVLKVLADGYQELDYVSNFVPERTYPRGLDVEAIKFAAIEMAWHEDQNPQTREHVTPYIYRNPTLFRIEGTANSEDLSHHRWTVDELKDLEFVRKVYGFFGDTDFDWNDVLSVLRDHPEWSDINKSVGQKEVPATT
jgi:spore coat polysaccharide biosynthesis protein SpsF